MNQPFPFRGVSLKLTLALVCLFVSLQSAGCAFKVRLVGEYDAITDQAVTALQQKTAAFFARVQSASGNDAAYDNFKGFYAQAKGDIAVLVLRAEISEEGLKHQPLADNFRSLASQYDDLQTLHRTSPGPAVWQSAEKAMDQSFRAVMENLLFLKWNQTQPGQ